jgi:hypothetical protein
MATHVGQKAAMADIERFFYDEAKDEFLRLDQTVRSHDDLIEFVASLRADLTDRPERWENRDVGSYLGSIARSMRDGIEDDYEILDRWATTAAWLWTGRNYE